MCAQQKINPTHLKGPQVYKNIKYYKGERRELYFPIIFQDKCVGWKELD